MIYHYLWVTSHTNDIITEIAHICHNIVKWKVFSVILMCNVMFIVNMQLKNSQQKKEHHVRLESERERERVRLCKW